MSSDGPIVPCFVHLPNVHNGSFNEKMTATDTGVVYIPKIHDYNQNVTGASSPSIELQKKERANSLQRFFSSIIGKGRRKTEKDAPSPSPEQQREYLEEEYVRDKISDCDLNQLVTLPAGLDYNEWLATHTISFYEHVNLMYGTVSEFCSKSGCSSMTGPANTQYLYVDEKNKKSNRPAPDYVNFVMNDCQKSIKDESVFPTKYGNVFPVTFTTVVRRIHRHLLHVLAHIYHAHFREIALLKLHPHLNTLTQHFMTFNRKHGMLEEKEAEVLEDLFVKLEGVVIPHTPSHKVPPSSVQNEGGEADIKTSATDANSNSSSPAKVKSACSEGELANNGAVIAVGNGGDGEGGVGGGSPVRVPPAAARGDAGSPNVIEQQPFATTPNSLGTNSSSNNSAATSPSSSPSKTAENAHLHHNNAVVANTTSANTSVPEQPQQWASETGGSTPQGGGSTPLSSSPTKYPQCDVTTRQPQAQPQDPNLMPSILSS